MSLSLMRMKTLSAPLQRMMAMVMIMMMVVFVLVTPLPSPRARLRRENVNMSNPHLVANHNNTSSAEGFTEFAVNNMGTHMGNSTEHATGNRTRITLMFHPGATGARCFLPTCGTVNLVNKMQGGEEKAGGATGDPYGPGKK
ncbi:uncharacterized protein zgc:193726 isoform X1 [Oreochromis aureus]|uniref:uncharacterized protein zgc:193726 isoform X1 n=2 Tax=Oreochromis aureus TaxID=47969 RepID=UPI0019541C8D|nr:uncharacterized protein zgc:193726 isoform X1 [Oreochromis aureus]